MKKSKVTRKRVDARKAPLTNINPTLKKLREENATLKYNLQALIDEDQRLVDNMMKKKEVIEDTTGTEVKTEPIIGELHQMLLFHKTEIQFRLDEISIKISELNLFININL